MSSDSLNHRVPAMLGTAAGFSPALACALNLIPGDKQGLSATFERHRPPDKVKQFAEEMRNPSPDSEAAWYLAALSVEAPQPVTQNEFLEQLLKFERLRNDPKERMRAALDTWLRRADLPA